MYSVSVYHDPFYSNPNADFTKICVIILFWRSCYNLESSNTPLFRFERKSSNTGLKSTSFLIVIQMRMRISNSKIRNWRCVRVIHLYRRGLCVCTYAFLKRTEEDGEWKPPAVQQMLLQSLSSPNDYFVLCPSPSLALQECIPFAVIGSNTVVEAKGKRVRGRLYPWGIVEGNLFRHFYKQFWNQMWFN